MPASFKHEFVPHVNFSFRWAMPHAKTGNYILDTLFARCKLGA
jgi:hypothetical protein